MATVAESLIIKLGLDAKDVRKGGQAVEADLKKVENQANKTGKELEKTAKKGKEFFGSLEAGLLSLIAAVGAARVVKDFFQDAIKGMADLGRKSEYLHMSASQLQAWGNVAESVGGTAADASNSLQALAGDFINLKVTGQSSFAPVLNRLGIDMRQFKNDADPLSSLLLALADKLKALSPQEALFFGKKLGFSDSMITALRQGRASVQSLLDAFRKASGATDENTKAAQKSQVAWQLIKARFVGIRDELEGRLTPVVQNLLERFADWVDKNKELITSRILEWVRAFANWLKSIDWKAIGNGLTAFLTGVVNLVSWLGKGVSAIGGWKNALIGLGAILSLNMLRPLTGIVGLLSRMIPMLASTTAGMYALAGGAAAIGGAIVGTGIWKAAEGTKAGDAIGSFVASIASYFSDDARDATERMAYGGASEAERSRQQMAYAMLGKKQRAAFDKEHPGVSQLIKSGIAMKKAQQAKGDLSYYAQHSRLLGDPKELFAELEKRNGLPSGLLNAVYQQESSGGKHLVSSAGAIGPFQMMPATAAQYGLKGNDLYDLDKEATAASLDLRDLYRKYHGNIALTLAAYNAGPGNVAKYGGIPPFAETQKYVANILPQLGQTGLTYGNMDNSRSSEVTIGTLQVNAPNATDARGIANALPGELRRNNLLAQGTTGLQ